MTITIKRQRNCLQCNHTLAELLKPQRNASAQLPSRARIILPILHLEASGKTHTGYARSALSRDENMH